MDILYLTNFNYYATNYVRDFDESFKRYSRNNFYYYDAASLSLNFDLSHFDAIFISFSFLANNYEWSSKTLNKLRSFKSLKIAVLQDEYLYFLNQRENLREIAIDAIITVMPESTWPDIFQGHFYDLPKLDVLTGYLPAYEAYPFSSRLPMNERKWKIGYRGRSYLPIFGALPQEKYELGIKMRAICEERCIAANIEVDSRERFYGEAWPRFIRDCRVQLGAESGCNVFDFTGEIKEKIKTYVNDNPDADFWSIHKNCIGEAEGKIRTNQISPRIFEAIAPGTGLMLYEGEYSGVIKP